MSNKYGGNFRHHVYDDDYDDDDDYYDDYDSDDDYYENNDHDDDDDERQAAAPLSPPTRTPGPYQLSDAFRTSATLHRTPTEGNSSLRSPRKQPPHVADAACGSSDFSHNDAANGAIATSSAAAVTEAASSTSTTMPSTPPTTSSATTTTMNATTTTNTNATTVVDSISVPYASSAVHLSEETNDFSHPRRLLRRKDDDNHANKDCFASLHDDALISIIRYLPDVRSVASLCCVNRYLDVALSTDSLYCREGNNHDNDYPEEKGDNDNAVSDNGHGGDKCGASSDRHSSLLLPSLHSIPVLPLAAGHDQLRRPKGVSRKYAFESNVWHHPPSASSSSTAGGYNTAAAAVTFHLVDQILINNDNNDNGDEDAAKLMDDGMTFVNRGVLAYVTDDGQITTRNVATSDAVSSCPPQQHEEGEGGNGQSSWRCLRYAFGNNKQREKEGGKGGSVLCAMLCTAGGRHRYRLSVVDLTLPPPSSFASYDPKMSHPLSHVVRWHIDDDDGLGNISTLQFSSNDELLLVGTSLSKCRVLNVTSGKEIWSLPAGEPAMGKVLLHDDRYVVGTSLVRGDDTVKVYDIRAASSSGSDNQGGGGPVAVARFTSSSSSPLRGFGGLPATMAVQGGRVFLATCYGMHCSRDAILRRGGGALDHIGDPRTNRHQSGSSGGGGGGRPPIQFPMKKVANNTTTSRPVLATGNGKVYVACGPRITVFDPRNFAQPWASYGCAPPSSVIDRLLVDDTKLVYAAHDVVGSRSAYVEILPIDAFFSPSCSSSEVVGTKPIRVDAPYMPDRIRFDAFSIDGLALRGNYLAASYSYSTGCLGRTSEVRVVDLSRLDEGRSSYKVAKYTHERWVERELDARRMRYSQRAATAAAATGAVDRERIDEDEREQVAAKDRKEKIIARKEAKKKKNRERKTTTRAASKQMSYSRGAKEGR